jgi:hypothetical protein
MLVFEALETGKKMAVLALRTCAITRSSLGTLRRTIRADIVGESVSIGTGETGCLVFVGGAVEHANTRRILQSHPEAALVAQTVNSLEVASSVEFLTGSILQ